MASCARGARRMMAITSNAETPRAPQMAAMKFIGRSYVDLTSL